MNDENRMTNDELPAGWCWSSSEELRTPERYSLAIGPFGSNLKVRDYREDGVPLVFVREIRAKDFAGNKTKFVTTQKAQELKAHSVSGGDLLITKMGDPPGDVAIYPADAPDAIITADCIKVRADPKRVHTSFLAYAVECPQTKSRLEEITAGVAQQKISLQRFRDFPLPLAPLAEQKRIADKLEAVLERVDACRARLDRVPALLKRFRQSVLAAATSGKLTEEWREAKQDKTKWTDTTIGSIAQDIRYGTAKKCQYEPVLTPVLRIPNIKEGRVDLTDLKSTSFESKELEKLALKTGDLLLIRSNGSVELVGRTALVGPEEESFLFAGYLIRIRVDRQRALPEFISLSLQCPKTRDAIERMARSSAGVNNINSEEIRGLKIPLPPLPEQQEIVRRVETLFSFADRIEARLAVARKTVERLTPAVLAKAFRGELVPQDPADEPASTLLERIRSQPAAKPAKATRIKRK